MLFYVKADYWDQAGQFRSAERQPGYAESVGGAKRLLRKTVARLQAGNVGVSAVRIFDASGRVVDRDGDFYGIWTADKSASRLRYS